MTATLLLIRHAAHVDLDRRLSGRRVGVPLSEAGRVQAEALGRRLAARGLTRIECSPLERTNETAAMIAAIAGLSAPIRAHPLIEIDMGDWTGRRLDDFGDDPEWRAWNERRATARIPAGESMVEAQSRIVGHLSTTASAHPDETVALVTHADMIRAAVAHVLGLSLDHLLRFDIDPASVTGLAWGDWGAKLLWLNEKVG